MDPREIGFFGCGLDLCNSWQGPFVDCFENGDEPTVSIKAGTEITTFCQDGQCFMKSRS